MPPGTESTDARASGSLRAALHANDPSGPAASRAVHALGLDYEHAAQGKPVLYPRFYVNMQTDGAVSTDIYQHRLWLDDARADAWQTVLVRRI